MQWRHQSKVGRWLLGGILAEVCHVWLWLWKSFESLLVIRRLFVRALTPCTPGFAFRCFGWTQVIPF